MNNRVMIRWIAIAGLILILMLFASTEMDFVYAGF
jgi:hypothetical protein